MEQNSRRSFRGAETNIDQKNYSRWAVIGQESRKPRRILAQRITIAIAWIYTPLVGIITAAWDPFVYKLSVCDAIFAFLPLMGA